MDGDMHIARGPRGPSWCPRCQREALFDPATWDRDEAEAAVAADIAREFPDHHGGVIAEVTTVMEGGGSRWNHSMGASLRRAPPYPDHHGGAIRRSSANQGRLLRGDGGGLRLRGRI